MASLPVPRQGSAFIVRFGISTHLYHQHELAAEHLREMAAFGFTELELFATIGHFNYRDPAAHAKLRAWLDDTGLTLHSVHAPIVEHLLDGQWGHPLSTAAAAEEARGVAVREAISTLGIARAIPFRYLVVHLGVPDTQAGPQENSRAAAERSLLQIAAAAADVGVQVAVEVIPNQLSTAEALVRCIEDDLDEAPPGIGICLDMGHAFLQGDLADAIETVSGDLVTTHVHDNRGNEDDHLVPFEGRIDWPTALMSMQKIGYEGTYLFEVANTASPAAVLEDTRRARQRFERTFAHP
jgi:sugar phosphate isomerase/epimerase